MPAAGLTRHGATAAPSPPPGDVAGRVGAGGFLSEQERGALGLVLIGGLGYARASRVLGICPRDMAALLRTALLRLAASSAAVAETAEEQEKVMQKLGYVTAITIAAAGAALGVMAVRSLPEVRRYMAMKKM